MALPLFLAQRLLQLIPTLFFVSVIIFGLQQLLPGDPALIMAGEERDPEVLAQIRQQYRLDQPIPVQYLYWIEGVLSGNLGESMRLKEPVLDARSRRSCRSRCSSPPMAIVIALIIGIPAGIISAVKKDTPGRLRRQPVRAVGHLHAQFLARHPADLPVLGRARLAAGLGLRPAWSRIWRASLADHHHAGLRARQRDRRRADAPHAQRHAAGAGQRLRPHRARQGPAERVGGPQARAAQRADAGDHAGRARARHAALRRGADRADLLHPGLRQADRRRRVQPRLRRGAGRRAGDRHDLHPAQPARRHRLRAGQSAAAGAEPWPHRRDGSCIRRTAASESPARARLAAPARAARARCSAWS